MSERKPLTPEELWQMNGKPVWIEHKERSGWKIIKFCDEPRILGFTDGEYEDMRVYGETWVAYTADQPRLNRKAWEPCEYCNVARILYQRTRNTKLYMDAFGTTAALMVECEACPPYAECCMKGVPVNSTFAIEFCPHCGRPLTDAAWDTLEKRLEGLTK